MEYQIGGVPYHWKRLSEEAQAAIVSFLHDQTTPAELQWVRWYLKHWINAPIWSRSITEPAARDQLLWLRQAIESMEDAESLRLWLRQATAIGIDPL